ncbi:hypothetical protein DBV05_g6701 [Lasiodiplodia theobromae]|uniref:Uncharacterized protein n=1 Tax=Lasiodiplodia theobromae TaxID=45133 RepID=A0A5N5DC08_9PEZI|nr:hypothetical protein DBV05_g6701 [Lasiodiplodia theobromae]
MPSTPSKRGRDDEETEEQVQKRQRLDDGSVSQTVDASSSSAPAMIGVPAQNVNNTLASSLFPQGSSSSSPAVASQDVASNAIPQQANTSTVPHWELCTIGGQQVTVLTDLTQVPASLFQPGLIFCGLTQTARLFFESKVAVAFDATRGQKYYSYNRLPHELRIPTRADAQQHRATVWERAAAYPDHTLATVRANDAQNAECWYNAAIDLSQMRDNLGGKGKGASRFLNLAENGQPHYSHEELTMLYFRFMDIVDDGSQNGFRVSTNTRHWKQVQRKDYNQTMTAQERLEDALQAIRNEKAIFSDLLGAEGLGNLVEFAHNPRAYADVKNEDRRANLNRGLAKDERKGPDAPDSFPWSEKPAGQRRACVYPGWTDIPPTHRITSAAAANAYIQSTIRRYYIPNDPTVAFFWAHLDDFAHLLYDSVVSTRGMQDNANGNQAKAFISAPPEYDTGLFERETRNIQAWCYLLCERLVEDAVYGYLMPQTDGQTPVESGRHTQCNLGQVFYGNRDLDVTLFQRFGAIQMALVCSKTIANPFRGDVSAFLRLSDLIWQPLAYLETKIQHRKSNNKRKTPAGPRNGDNGEGSSSGAMGNQASGPAANQQHTSTQGNQLAQANNAFLNANTPMDGMGPGPSGSGPLTGSGIQNGMQSAPSRPLVNTNNSTLQPQSDYPPIFATQPDNSIPCSQPESIPPPVVVDPFDEEKWDLSLDFDRLRVDESGNLTTLPVDPAIQGQVPGSGYEAQGIPPQNILASQIRTLASAPANTSDSQPAMPDHLHVPTPASGDEIDTGLNAPSQEDSGNSNVDAPVTDGSPTHTSAEHPTDDSDRELDEMSELSEEEWVEYMFGSREVLDWEREMLRKRAERAQSATPAHATAGLEESTGNNNNNAGSSDPSSSDSHGVSGQAAAADGNATATAAAAQAQAQAAADPPTQQ